MLHRFLALLSTRDAGPYPFVFQACLNWLARYVIPDQLVNVGLAAEHRPCLDVVPDLTCGDEQVERAVLAITERVLLGVHPALCATDEASTPPLPPFFASMLLGEPSVRSHRS